jgi:uroporphyrinogen decarboxylase
VDGAKMLNRDPYYDWRQKYFGGAAFEPGTTWDAWGIGHEPKKESMHMTRMLHPMENFSSLEEFQAYPYPVFDGENIAHLCAQVDALHARGLAATGNMACTIWETAWYMRGMEKLMMDMLDESELATYHLDRVTECAIIRATAFARAGVDHLHLGDDIGMQKTIMMSFDLYRTWLKPRLRRVIAAAKSAKPDIIVSYHSCGYVTPFIDDLIEAGIDVLNPIQPECMDFASIHAQYGDRLSFWGTLGTQTVFPFGSPAEVKEQVRRNLEIAGAQGGLLCAPSHLLEPEVPWENVLAYVEACAEFGKG